MNKQIERKRLMTEALASSAEVFESAPFGDKDGRWDPSMTEAEQRVYDKISVELHNLTQLLRTIR